MSVVVGEREVRVGEKEMRAGSAVALGSPQLMPVVGGVHSPLPTVHVD